MKKRILSAIIMAIILIPILIIGNKIFALTMGFIGVLAFKELINLKESHSKIPDLLFFLGLINLLLIIFSGLDGIIIPLNLEYKNLAFCILCMFLPCLFSKNKNYSTHTAFYLIGCIIFLGVVFNSFILLRNFDIWRLIYIILIVTMTDIFALVIGKLIGKHKCAPNISPGKTWEGSVGGTFVGTIVPTIFYINIINQNNLIKIIFITLILSIIGQLGDLFFSKIKRENKIKDFGNLIPGHGGVLDRIDSLIFVLLTYIILIKFI